jgi:hypothetical protein
MRIQLTDEAARELAERLADDDAFREAVTADPRSALAPYHIELEDEDLRKVARLPPKEAVREAIRGVETAARDQEEGFFDMLAFLFSVFPRPSLEPAYRAPARSTRKKAGKAKSAPRKKKK